MRRILDPSFELNKTERPSCAVKSVSLFSATSELLVPAFLDADLLEEHDVNNGNSRSETLQSMRYQPRESQILILLIIIPAFAYLVAKVIIKFINVKD